MVWGHHIVGWNLLRVAVSFFTADMQMLAIGGSKTGRNNEVMDQRGTHGQSTVLTGNSQARRHYVRRRRLACNVVKQRYFFIADIRRRIESRKSEVSPDRREVLA
jgi:hypothetical protein